MTIDVKGTKTNSGTESASWQTYALKEARLSKMPLAFGAMILGIAAYLKSAMPSWGRLPPEEGAPVRPEEAGEPRLKLVDTGMMAAPLEPLEQGDQGDAAPDEDRLRPAGSGTPYDGRLEPAEFMALNEPSLHYPEPFVHKADISGLGRFQGSMLVANDNAAPAMRGTSGQTGVGGSVPAEYVPPKVDRPPGKPPVRNDDDEEDSRTPANRAPRTGGPVYLHDVAGCAVVIIGLTDLLANASDPDGDVLSVRNIWVSSGTITWTANGWLYDPNGLGPVTVSYEITDGEATIVQHAYFSVVRNSIVGTDGDDMLLGTACADAIEGRAGHDLIDGRAGDDLIDGGAGDDHLVGGTGSDVLRGGAGNDVIFGGSGDDQVSGGEGDDRLFGDDGNDTVFGDGGNDQIHGGNGNDALFGGAGNDTVRGDAGDDKLEGNAGNDVLDGGDGADVISGGGGNDVLEGGAGADLLLDDEGQDTVSGGDGNDHVIVAHDSERDGYAGGGGSDTLDLSRTGRGVEVDLAQGSAGGCEIGDNDVDGFEIVTGGSGADTLSGSGGNETLSGGSGDDMIDGRVGNDSLDGGTGDDTLADGAGRDTVSGGAGNDVVRAETDGEDDVYDGGSGCDTLDYSSSEGGITADFTNGTASGCDIGNDTISGFETVVGGSGDDHFVVGQQPVVLEGGAGNDLFEFTPPPTNAPALVLHEIVDFKAGDRIRMSKYDLFEKVFDRLEDQFESIYGNKVDDDDARIRFRHERSESIDRTVIEADIDRDNVYETTIHLDGHRAIVIVEHA